jgi:tetratricopeptide (TPR) repeat protein
MVYHENQLFPKANKIYQNIFDKVVNEYGEKNSQALSIMTNWGNTLLELGKYKQAYQLFKNCTIIREAILPDGHLYLSYSYLGLGRASFQIGDTKNGIKYISKALAIRRKQLPASSWLLGEALYYKAQFDMELGDNNMNDINQACNILIQAKGSQGIYGKKCKAYLQINQ